ncbi:hypothetical protein ACWD25_50035, partial [Streptomyces sp. NPDC002920]
MTALVLGILLTVSVLGNVLLLRLCTRDRRVRREAQAARAAELAGVEAERARQAQQWQTERTRQLAEWQNERAGRNPQIDESCRGLHNHAYLIGPPE